LSARHHLSSTAQRPSDKLNMNKSTELSYIQEVLSRNATAMAKHRSYAAFYLDEDKELHIYEASDVHKLKLVMDEKHPGFELVHIEGYPDSSTARNLAAAARQIREIRKNALSISVVVVSKH